MKRPARLLLWILLAGMGSVDATWAGAGSSKIGPALRALHEEHAAHQSRGSVQPFRSRNRLVRVVGERVIVDAIAEGDVHALEADLFALRMRNVSVFGRVVSGALPLSSVPALDSLATLRFVRPSTLVRRQTRAPRTGPVATREGSVTSEGDEAMRADAARVAFGVTGAGVRVGVLSDSFDCKDGAERDLASGDLSPVTVLEESPDCEEGKDEGRAMLQIVHDVAPGASLSFATALNGMAGFAKNVLALWKNGAKVIVDDVQYFDEPMFQDGITAQAVDTVVAQGVAFFSSAGNEARNSYESVFRAGSTFGPGFFPSAEGAPPFRGGVAHVFALARGSDHMQRIIINEGGELQPVLQWDSPFFSVSGAPGSSNDLDVYLLDATGTRVVAGATSDNVGRDAVEYFGFRNEGPRADFNLMIVKFQGEPPGLMKYVDEGHGARIDEDNTKSSTVFGHNQASGAMAVGAAGWYDTPAFGETPPRLQSYSSAGPVRILFDTAGQRMATPIVRAKPEVVAPDDVTTSVDGFEEFPGTSAAAPHAAGVAALLLQQRPDLLPAAVYEALQRTAVDMRAPGSDTFAIGAGLIRADAALQSVSTPKITLGLTLNRQTVVPGDPVQITFSASNAGTSGLRDVYLLAAVPSGLSAALGCPEGDAVLVAENPGFTSFVTRCAGTAPIQSFPPIASSLPFPAGEALVALPTLSFAWPVGLPSGIYTWIILSTPPAAFADGKVDPGDIDATAFDSVHASP